MAAKKEYDAIPEAMLKKEIIQFLKSQHQKTGKAPSIRKICKRFGLSSKTLYELFPGCKTEMCSAAGVPIDTDSFKQVARANQVLKTKREKEAHENKQLTLLREEKEKIAEELRRTKAVDECQETIRKLYIEKTRTSGIKDVFSSPEKMLDFVIHSHQRGSRTLDGIDILDSFSRRCAESNLPVAKTLYETVGPLEDYEATLEEGEARGLVDYIQERLEDFLLERETEETQRAMQAEFESILQNFRCNECGRDATTTYLVSSKLRCPCGSSWDLLCINCKKELRFDPRIGALHCRACGMSFKFVARK